MTNVIQILAFRSPDSWSRLGPCLLAAMTEIENFYNFDEPRISCARFVLNPAASAASLQEFTSGTQFVDFSGSESFWVGFQGKFRSTIHQGRLASALRQLLPVDHKNSFCVIITDEEIEPPPNWRYIIWDSVDNGSVISTAPTDPDYWRERSQNAVGTMKHRVRTAGMNITGIALGLTRCKNPSCFLFDDVESNDVLDTMLSLGNEHSWMALSGNGYSPRPLNPNEVQLVEPVVLPSRKDFAQAFESNVEWNTLL